MQFPRALARSARQASERRDGVNAGLEQHGVVPVGPTDQHHQWNATSVYDNVPFGSQGEFNPSLQHVLFRGVE